MRALHAGIFSQEKNKMAARSGGGFTCCVPGCFTNSKRDTHLSFYVFPKEKNLRRRWLHSISRKNFKPTTGHRVCSLHFRGGKKNLHEQCSCFFFSFGKISSQAVTRTKEKTNCSQIFDIQPRDAAFTQFNSFDHYIKG